MFSVFLDEIKIGTTKLENRDSSMGVAFGKINIINKEFDYDFIKKFCIENDIEINFDDNNQKLISTRNISNFKIFKTSNNIEIESEIGCNLEGMNEEGFQITVLGISNSFFEKELL
ncbi:hypothetical protein WH52_07820 [Tenacibaculum holothuriorum]|uniref:Uncharacterized protein n=1 Tax=Tenacibaculum holothuriorum TaxID=1635173 RepID=A0A1Y2PD51_9FLAO|nr:hypothetical protein [Tenacibaculum holothuriorum]OSY87941.1 hypothetical protein WH52_07820 [Tenacibaculum holothuriorum]